MSHGANKKRSFEYIKLIAACFVVFIHVRFPGMTGRVFDAIARFAVPFFFACSGYFSFQIGSARLAKRLRHIMFLILSTTALYSVYDAAQFVLSGKGTLWRYLAVTFTAKSVARWLFMNLPPGSAYHLWYLPAALTCYAVLWLYVKFQEDSGAPLDYRPLYMAGAALLMIHVMCSLKFVGAGMKLHYNAYRDGLFFGLPMFCTGVFIREYRDRLVRAFHLTTGGGLVLFIVGQAFGVFQFIQIGKVEMPLGAFFSIFGLLLFAAGVAEREESSPWKDACARVAGSCSLTVYVMHVMIHQVVYVAAKSSPFWAGVVNAKSAYPLVIAGLSLLLGLAVASVKEVRRMFFSVKG